jgi:uncharacterized protein
LFDPAIPISVKKSCLDSPSGVAPPLCIAKMLTVETVQTAFQPFENSDPPSFFKNYVTDDIIWTTTGSIEGHSGTYSSKREVVDNALNPVVRRIATLVESKIKSIMVSGDWAIVEHTAEAKTKKGMDMFQEFCWVCRFEEGKIVQVRMYFDTAMVMKVLAEHD